MNWDWAFTFDVVVPRLWDAAGVTVYVTIMSFLLALVFGMALMLAKISPLKWLSIPITELIEFIRGTPLLVQIFFLFFVLPEIGLVLPPLTTGIVAIALYNSALCAEVYRAGLEAVPRGQWEACTALNFSSYQSLKRIIIPQSLPPIVPALGNHLIAIFKETPLLSFVAVHEVMETAKLVGVETYRFTEAITLAGVFFLIMSIVSAQAIRLVENYINRRTMH